MMTRKKGAWAHHGERTDKASAGRIKIHTDRDSRALINQPLSSCPLESAYHKCAVWSRSAGQEETRHRGTMSQLTSCRVYEHIEVSTILMDRQDCHNSKERRSGEDTMPHCKCQAIVTALSTFDQERPVAEPPRSTTGWRCGSSQDELRMCLLPALTAYDASRVLLSRRT